MKSYETKDCKIYKNSLFETMEQLMNEKEELMANENEVLPDVCFTLDKYKFFERQSRSWRLGNECNSQSSIVWELEE